MFPLVPYHNLPRLHAMVKPDMPTPYRNLLDAWREIIPALLRQVKDPGYFVSRKLPTPSVRAASNVAAKTIVSTGLADGEGWIEVGSAGALGAEDVLRFDYAGHTYAVYRAGDGNVYATDGICTHGNTHLATGLVKGCLIECPKHNGRFDVRDGSPKRAPVCQALRTYPVRVDGGRLFLNVVRAGGEGAARVEKIYRLRVAANRNVATYIKELTLEVPEGGERPPYQPGQYMQVKIPAYGSMPFSRFEVDEPYRALWQAQHVFDYAAENRAELRRNYSLATNPIRDRALKFNIRIAAPPRGQDCLAGAGSSYMWSLKPGDRVELLGPFGEFLIRDTGREMVYLGGGSGMAPLRSHLSHLFETQQTDRKVSFWYGARSRQELFYQDYFGDIAARFPNFAYHPALSEPQPEDAWAGSTGLIHEVLRDEYLAQHKHPASVEYYLCGPQPMIQAARHMLAALGVPPGQIAFDEF